MACMSVRLFACPRSKRKTAWAINITLGTHNALWQELGRHWPWGQKVKGQVHTVMKTVTFARLQKRITETASMVVFQVFFNSSKREFLSMQWKLTRSPWSWTLGMADRTAPSHTSTITWYVFERSTRSVDKRSSYLRERSGSRPGSWTPVVIG